MYDSRRAAGRQRRRLQHRLGLLQITCIRRLGGRPGQRALPIPAASALVGYRFGHERAKPPRQCSELPDPARQQRFEFRAHRLRQHRRRAARPNRGDDLAPVEDRRHGEVTVFGKVDHIDRNAPRPHSGQRGGTVRLVCLGDDRQARALERCLARRAAHDRHTTLELGRQCRLGKSADQHQIGGEGQQQAQLARRLLAVPEHHDPGAVEIEKGWKLAHGRNSLV